MQPRAWLVALVAAPLLSGCFSGGSPGDNDDGGGASIELVPLPEPIEFEGDIAVSNQFGQVSECNDTPAPYCRQESFGLGRQAFINAEVVWDRPSDADLRLRLVGAGGVLAESQFTSGVGETRLLMPLLAGEYAVQVVGSQVRAPTHYEARLTFLELPSRQATVLERPSSSVAMDVTPTAAGGWLLTYEATIPAATSDPVSANGAILLTDIIPITPAVGSVALEITAVPRPDTTFPQARAVLRDEGAVVHCHAYSYWGANDCRSPVLTPLAQNWTLTVNTGGRATAAIDVEVRLTVDPPVPAMPADALAGIDTSIEFRTSVTGYDGMEDSIGFLSDGTTVVLQGVRVLASPDRGATWRDITGPVPAITSDPYMVVDTAADAIFVSHWQYPVCARLDRSLDAGQTWTVNPVGCSLPGFDHQKIATAPHPAGLPLPAVYFMHASGEVAAIHAGTSLDGGQTFTSVVVAPKYEDGVYIRGNGELVARDGIVMAPLSSCRDPDGFMQVASSNNHGVTWSVTEIPSSAMWCGEPDAGMAVDDGGTFYVAWAGVDGVDYSHSRDGLTWSEPVRVWAGGTAAMVTAIAGSDGRIAIAFRGTPDDVAPPVSVDGDAAWHIYAAFVEDATTSPNIRVGIANDPVDPVQRGPICLLATNCATARNLLDFMDIGVAPDGRVAIAYTDGCVHFSPCGQPYVSRDKVGVVAFLDDGPLLFEGRTP